MTAGGLQVKVWTLVIMPLTWVRLVTSSALESRQWQLIDMSQWCRSALCAHPLPALTDNWTNGAASRHTVAPIRHTRPSPRSRSYCSFPVPFEGRRLSRPEHTVGYQLAQGCLQWTGCESNPQPLGYEGETTMTMTYWCIVGSVRTKHTIKYAWGKIRVF